jgi:uncharacterized protein
VVVRFGLPAVLFAYFSARLLVSLASAESTISYELFSWRFETTPLNMVMWVLILLFAVLEIVPHLQRVSVDRKYLPLGGVLSGFFGGLSGHQGAFRSVFLLRSGLSRDAFIASGIAIALLVDAVRLSVYGLSLSHEVVATNLLLLLIVIAATFLGAFVGNRFAKRTTLRSVQLIVSMLLFIVAAGV